MSAWVISLISVIIGTITGFVLNLLRDECKERKKKKQYFNDLLKEIEFNEIVFKEGRRWFEFQTLAYTDTRSAKYFIELPDDLQMDIRNLYAIIFNLHNRNIEPLNGNIQKVASIAEKIIPKFKEYLKIKNY